MLLSSIFSFDTFQVRVRVSWRSLILIIPILLTELALRVPAVTTVLPRPEPTLWYAPLIQTKLDYFKEFQRNNGIDVLFIGDSSVQAGVDPEVFDKECPPKGDGSCGAFNGGIEGLPPYGVRLFLEIYLQYCKPTSIVYGLLPGNLNSGSPWAQDVTDQVKHCAIAQAQAQRGLNGWLCARLLDWSRLFRYRFILLQTILRGGRFEAQPHVYFNHRGFHPQPGRLTDVPSNLRGALQTRYNYLNYSTKGIQSEELCKVIEICQRKGISLILMNMPVADGYYDNFERRDDYWTYLATLRTICRQYQLPLWDVENIPADFVLRDSDFWDLHHLNQFGAKKLSNILAGYFKQSGRGAVGLARR